MARWLLCVIACLCGVVQAFTARAPGVLRVAGRRVLDVRSPLSMTALQLESVKNFRDLQTASPRINILASKVFRTGCISKASPDDVSCCLCQVSRRGSFRKDLPLTYTPLPSPLSRLPRPPAF